MPEAATAFDPKAAEGKLSDLLSGMDKDAGSLDTAASQFSSNVASADAAEQAEFRSTQAARDKLTPPKLETPPSPNVQPTDPKAVWGSLAMIVAGFGSAMTRQPLTTAMNAAAQVINGYAQRDQETYDRAYKTWEIASKNAVEIANYQQKAYDEALAHLDRADRMTIEERAATEREAYSQYMAQATAFRDDVALKTGEARGLQGLLELHDRRAYQSAELERITAELPAEKAKGDAIMKVVSSEEYRLAENGDPARGIKPDPVKALTMLRGVEGSGVGDGSPTDRRLAIATYNAVVQAYPKDPVTGVRQGAPGFEDWYKHKWPTFGEETPDAPGGGQQPAPGKGGTDKIEPVPVPPAFANKPDGFRVHDGKRVWVKKGKFLVPTDETYAGQ